MKEGFILPHRVLVKVTGSEAKTFLQGLISNDINLARSDELLYSFFLSPQGKYLADFFVLKMEDGYFLDLPKDNAATVLKRLNMYRLRADVQIENSDLLVCIADHGYLDPRNAKLPKRAYLNAAESNQQALDEYHRQRILLKVAEGGIDLHYDNGYILHYGAEFINGVSFTKGCYVGQEVTARMHHRDAVRKALFILEGDAFTQQQDVIQNGNRLGITLSYCNGYGLALLNSAELNPSSLLQVESNNYKIHA